MGCRTPPLGSSGRTSGALSCITLSGPVGASGAARDAATDALGVEAGLPVPPPQPSVVQVSKMENDRWPHTVRITVIASSRLVHVDDRSSLRGNNARLDEFLQHLSTMMVRQFAGCLRQRS